MTIRKMTLITNICLALSVAAMLCCFLMFSRASQNIEQTIINKEICLSLGNELRQSSADLTKYVRLYAASGDPQYKDAYQGVLDEREGRKARSPHREYFPNERHALLGLLGRYGLSQDELAFIETANRLSENLVPLEVEAINAVEGKFKDALGNYNVKGRPDRDLALSLVFGQKYDDYTAPIMRAMDNFEYALFKRLDAIVEQARAEEKLYERVFIASVILMFAVVVFSIWYTRNVVVAPLIRTKDFSLSLAEGHFDTRIPVHNHNEIGQLRLALNSMADQINHQVKSVLAESANAKEQSVKAREAMERAEQASTEATGKTKTMQKVAQGLEKAGQVISSATSELSRQLALSDQGAQDTAQRLSTATSAIGQMNSTVREVARSAGVAANASMETKDKAQIGARIVERSLASIDSVRDISMQLREDMSQLNESAQSITQIMGVILEIADQTNLLALNAAIEAARAGESGRGFAVVADEVRKLAEKTMASTSDVRAAINTIQTSTEKSMASVATAVEQIKHATELAGQSGEALQEIVVTVDATADQIHAIATASEEQSAASEEINNSVALVNEMAGKTADSMHRAAQVVADLAQQAEELTNMIGDLKQK